MQSNVQGCSLDLNQNFWLTSVSEEKREIGNNPKGCYSEEHSFFRLLPNELILLINEYNSLTNL